MSAERDEQLTLSDATQLTARIWSPSGAGPWPTLLMRQPYGRRIASTVTLAHPSWWTSKGYLVVVQDVRGQGDSGGSFTGFQQEALDTAETLAWVRALPDCNGRIGCYGFSYQGVTQLLAPPHTPPPDCMAPAMAGLDERLHWSCEGGAHWWHLGLGWGLQLAAQQTRRRGDSDGWREIRQALVSGDYLHNGLDLLQRHDPEGMAWRWFGNDPGQPQDWQQHSVDEAWLRQPLLLIGGWWDPHLMGILDLWQKSRAAGGTPELHIGPATHLQWWPDAQQLLLNFFDHHLKGIGSTAISSAERPLFQLWDLGEQRWIDQSAAPMGSWSLTGSGENVLNTNDGRLQQGVDGSGEVPIVHDPWRPAPAEGGHLSPSAGPCDRSVLDQRSDVATFTSDQLSEALVLEGRPELQLNLKADQPGFDVAVALSRLPSGSSQVEQLSTGVYRCLGDEALQLKRHRVLLQPLRVSLKPGDRLRLSVAGAAWPAIGVNPGTPDHPAGAPGPDHRVVTMTLQLAGSALELIPLNSGKLSEDSPHEL